MFFTNEEFKNKSIEELYNQYIILEGAINNEICIMFGEGYEWWEVDEAEYNFSNYCDQFIVINQLLIINDPLRSPEDLECAKLVLDELLGEELQEDTEIVLGLVGGIEVKGAKALKGKSFRGGPKKLRDNWYGFKDKDFQRWWHRKGKAEWGNTDITTKEMAEEVYRAWVESGKPKAEK
jgi:hypothetical protein